MERDAEARPAQDSGQLVGGEIDGQDGPAPGEQALDEMGAYEAARAEDENSHLPFPERAF
jgi:hypothetical protein